MSVAIYIGGRAYCRWSQKHPDGAPPGWILG